MTYMTAINTNPRTTQAHKVELPVPQPTKLETFYQLNLTPEEVVALRALAAHVGGSPSQTARGFIDSIRSKLPEASNPEQYDEEYVAYDDVQVSCFYFAECSLGDGFQQAVAALK